MTWTLWRGDDPPAVVPPERLLRIRDDADRVVPTRHVTVQVERPDPAHLPSELATFPEGTFVEGSVWLVSFSEDPEVPVT